MIDSDWGESRPSADGENEFLDNHTSDGCLAWHLGLTAGANPEPKPSTHSATATSDASAAWASSQVAQWHHKVVELAAHDLLQHLDDTIA